MNTDDLEILKEKYKQDFDTAFNIYVNDYSNQDLIEFLKTGSIVEKQAAAIKIEHLSTREDVEIFMNNLTGCDGKIREAVSFRLPEFVKSTPEYFTPYIDIFLNAIIDINGNICRNTISALNYLKSQKEFTKEFCAKLTSKTLELAKIAKTFDIQDGKYKINKEIFKLYWYLETIYHFAEFIDTKIITLIIFETKDIMDYTIREKSAKILTKIQQDENLLKITEELRSDQNYYVRRF